MGDQQLKGRAPGWCLALVLNSVVVFAGIAPPGTLAGVTTAPQVRGTVALVHRDCQRDRDHDAVIGYCEFLYTIDAGAGSDSGRYSVTWTQLAVEPRFGWCIAAMQGVVRRTGAEVVGVSHDYGPEAGVTESRLVVHEHGRRLASLAQTSSSGRGETTKVVNDRDDGVRWKWRHRDHTKKAQAILGIAFRGVGGSEGDLVLTETSVAVDTIRC